jgi:hypothetical protein
MRNKKNLDINDWRPCHAVKAASQGWCLIDTDQRGSSPIELQKIDDAAGKSIEYGVPVLSLVADDDAVDAFRVAYENREDHAVLAYQILKWGSPGEFEYWDMLSWQVSKITA